MDTWSVQNITAIGGVAIAAVAAAAPVYELNRAVRTAKSLERRANILPLLGDGPVAREMALSMREDTAGLLARRRYTNRPAYKALLVGLAVFTPLFLIARARDPWVAEHTELSWHHPWSVVPGAVLPACLFFALQKFEQQEKLRSRFIAVLFEKPDGMAG
jgi:hypothetical protein